MVFFFFLVIVSVNNLRDDQAIGKAKSLIYKKYERIAVKTGPKHMQMNKAGVPNSFPLVIRYPRRYKL